MLTHRRFLMGLTLGALVGLMGNQAHAGSISISVVLSGTTLETYTGSTTTFTADPTQLAALNAKLGALASVYTVSGLTATSNFGEGMSPGFLHDGITTNEVTGTNTEELVFKVTQDGFLTPAPGSTGVSLLSTASYNGSPGAGGNATFVSTYESSSAPTITLTPTTSNSPQTLVGLGPIPTGGYTLTDTTTVSYTGTGNSQTTSGTGSVSATAIPEPSSVVMVLTGMPLAIVFGLIRGRRRAAA